MPESAKGLRIGVILETKEAEKAWNAFRFGVKALENGHEVRLFLLGEAVECQDNAHDRFDVRGQMEAFTRGGGGILACGTCLRSRGMEATELCPVSTMQDLVDLVTWSERLVSL